MTEELTTVEDFAILRQDPNEVVALIQDELGGEMLDEWTLDRVKVPAGGGLAWEVPSLDGAEITKELIGVAIHTKLSRAYWRGTYGGDNQPPDCSSADARHAVPREGWSPPARREEGGTTWDCGTCQLAAWGSAEEGRGQACKLTRQIFLLRPDVMLPIVLTLPPTSIKAARTFFLGLANRGVRKDAVVTGVSLAKARSGDGIEYSRAEFRLVGQLEPKTSARIRAYADALRPSLAQIRVESADELS